MIKKLIMMFAFALMLTPAVGVEASTTTTSVVENYGNVAGNTLTKYYTDGILTNSTVRDSQGNTLFTYSYHSNQKVERKVTYNASGVRTKTTLYNTNGVATYSYSYNSNGSVKERVKYSNKVRVETVRYATNGNRTAAYTYYSSGKVKQKINYSNGKRSQTIQYDSKGNRTKVYTYYTSGKVRKVYYYKNGKQNLTKELSESTGKEITRWTYQKNGKVGLKTSYGSDGSYTVMSFDVKGGYKLEKGYSSKKVLDYTISYKGGTRDIYKEYRTDGTLRKKVEFKNAYKTYEYDNNEKLVKVIVGVADQSLCSGPETYTCSKIQEYNSNGKVTKTYYDWHYLG